MATLQQKLNSPCPRGSAIEVRTLIGKEVIALQGATDSRDPPPLRASHGFQTQDWTQGQTDPKRERSENKLNEVGLLHAKTTASPQLLQTETGGYVWKWELRVWIVVEGT